jgi:Xaa-Pro aminopeptidase
MADHVERLDRVRTIAAERGLDAILISHPANRFYLSGYTAEDIAPNSIAGALVIAPDAALLLTSPNNVDWARSETPEAIEVAAWKRPWPASLAEAIGERGWRKLGFEDEAILFSFHQGITAALGERVELVPLGDSVDRLRRVKDAAEQELIARAIRIGDAAFVAAIDELKPGVTEKHLARRIEDLIREHGGDGLAFPPIVAAGPHAARPHHAPTDHAIEAGEPVIIDMGARVEGYNGDLTRTVWIGEPSARLREVYRVVQAMQDAAFAKIAAGKSAKDADGATREVATAAGFGEYLVHGLGHGIGARVHEGPSSSDVSEDVYQRGEVTTVEPGLYLPGWGGVRIEDVGVVEEGGFRNLTTAPKRSPES